MLFFSPEALRTHRQSTRSTSANGATYPYVHRMTPRRVRGRVGVRRASSAYGDWTTKPRSFSRIGVISMAPYNVSPTPTRPENYPGYAARSRAKSGCGAPSSQSAGGPSSFGPRRENRAQCRNRRAPSDGSAELGKRRRVRYGRRPCRNGFSVLDSPIGITSSP